MMGFRHVVRKERKEIVCVRLFPPHHMSTGGVTNQIVWFEGRAAKRSARVVRVVRVSATSAVSRLDLGPRSDQAWPV